MFSLSKVALKINKNIELVVFKQKKGRVLIEKKYNSEIANNENKDEVIDALSRIVIDKKLKGKRTFFTYDNSHFFIKTLELPDMSNDEIKEAIKWEIEPFLSYDVSEMTFDYWVTGRLRKYNTTYINLIVVAITSKSAIMLTEIVEKAGLKPMVLEVELFALLRYLSFLENAKDTVFIYSCNYNGQMIYIDSKDGKVIFRNLKKEREADLDFELDYFCDYVKDTGNKVEKVVSICKNNLHVPSNIEVNSNWEGVNPICFGLCLRGSIS